MKKILIHVCCAPCAAPSVERIKFGSYDAVGLYFSNSNIFPHAEYEKRLESVQKLAGICEVVVEQDVYDHDSWLRHIKGFEGEPEKGLRCEKCFEYSLSRTAAFADKCGYDVFTTTLTLSPHKISKMIFAIGAKYPKYLPCDFKKQDGFLRSLQLSTDWGLYRQNYCGCEFSKSAV